MPSRGHCVRGDRDQRGHRRGDYGRRGVSVEDVTADAGITVGEDITVGDDIADCVTFAFGALGVTVVSVRRHLRLALAATFAFAFALAATFAFLPSSRSHRTSTLQTPTSARPTHSPITPNTQRRSPRLFICVLDLTGHSHIRPATSSRFVRTALSTSSGLSRPLRRACLVRFVGPQVRPSACRTSSRLRFRSPGWGFVVEGLRRVVEGLRHIVAGREARCALSAEVARRSARAGVGRRGRASVDEVTRWLAWSRVGRRGRALAGKVARWRIVPGSLTTPPPLYMCAVASSPSNTPPQSPSRTPPPPPPPSPQLAAARPRPHQHAVTLTSKPSPLAARHHYRRGHCRGAFVPSSVVLAVGGMSLWSRARRLASVVLDVGGRGARVVLCEGLVVYFTRGLSCEFYMRESCGYDSEARDLAGESYGYDGSLMLSFPVLHRASFSVRARSPGVSFA
ncbi:hypothetical protein BD626DRAFT_539223 [Schizophyllum amplum]|uniref:Uncharacterized protein n=1 Tax=Schizophyllum amplum TaxID=97359 RepID=A0A550C4S3_9AGAR|nr:hypothetical protein BD626DRAFT_539223 [Auriculariopsis ampla]